MKKPIHPRGVHNWESLMNIKKLFAKMHPALIALIVVLLGLVGCGIVEVSTIDPGSSEVDGSGVGAIEVGVEPTPTPEGLIYSNETYGFQFEYPITWNMTEEDNGVILNKGNHRLGINFRWADESDVHPYFGRTGMGAGDLIYAGKISFLGQVIPAEVLLQDKKSKAVLYNGTDLIEIDNLVFMIVLEDLETAAYEEVDLSEEIMAEARAIVESFKWLEMRSAADTNSHAVVLEATLTVKHVVQPESGEAVKLNFRLVNRSERPLYILKWYTPLEGMAGDIFEVTRDGQAVPYLGILATRGNPTPESYIYLEPGESVSTDINLETGYDFSQPGLYTIKFRSPRISHIAGSEAEMATTVDELGPIEIPSNEVNIPVGSTSGGAGMPAGPTSEAAREMIAAFLQVQKASQVEGFSLQVEEIPFMEAAVLGPVQIYKVAEGPFRNESFLLNGEQVIQLGTAMGGQGLTSLAIADLDRDTRYELLFTYSGGLGPQAGAGVQSRIGGYAPAYDATQTFEADMAYMGDISLLAENATKVALQVVEPNEDASEIGYHITLGYLSIDHQDEGVSLVLEVAPDLPGEVRQNLLTME